MKAVVTKAYRSIRRPRHSQSENRSPAANHRVQNVEPQKAKTVQVVPDHPIGPPPPPPPPPLRESCSNPSRTVTSIKPKKVHLRVGGEAEVPSPEAAKHHEKNSNNDFDLSLYTEYFPTICRDCSVKIDYLYFGGELARSTRQQVSNYSDESHKSRIISGLSDALLVPQLDVADDRYQLLMSQITECSIQHTTTGAECPSPFPHNNEDVTVQKPKVQAVVSGASKSLESSSLENDQCQLSDLQCTQPGLICFSRNSHFPFEGELPLDRIEHFFRINKKLATGSYGPIVSMYYQNICYAVKQTILRKTELAILHKIDHGNIIKLQAAVIGNQRRDSSQLTCYHFMPFLISSLQQCAAHYSYGLPRFLHQTTRLERPSLINNLKHVLLGTVQALAYLHRKGCLHLNIKPSNILVHTECAAHQEIPLICPCVHPLVVQVTGFGNSVMTPDTAVAPVKASAPERFACDGAVDVWSFGGLICTLLTGYQPTVYKPQHHAFASARGSDELSQTSALERWMPNLLSYQGGDLQAIAELALQCLLSDGRLPRPTAQDIVDAQALATKTSFEADVSLGAQPLSLPAAKSQEPTRQKVYRRESVLPKPPVFLPSGTQGGSLVIK